MLVGADAWDANRLTLQVTNGPDAVTSEKLVATGVDAAENHQRVPKIESENSPGNRQQTHVDLACDEALDGRVASTDLYVVDLGETFGREQRCGNLRWRLAEARCPKNPQFGCLGR